MESLWLLWVKLPSGEKTMDDFARAIDRIPKLVFSHTLDGVSWDSARLATNFGLLYEYRLLVHPVIVGKGLPLLKDIDERLDLSLVRSGPFRSGAVELCYRIS